MKIITPLVSYWREIPARTRLKFGVVLAVVVLAGGGFLFAAKTGKIGSLADTNSGKIIGAFTKLPEVRRILGAGGTKASIVMASGVQVDLRVVPPESFGAALQYFTGSKAHNIRLRTLARKHGLKVSEYGVFRGRAQSSFQKNVRAAYEFRAELPIRSSFYFCRDFFRVTPEELGQSVSSI